MPSINLKKFFGIGKPGLGDFGTKFKEGVTGLREIREQKVQPFFKSFFKEAVLPAANLVESKIRRPAINFLEEGRKAEAERRVSRGFAKDIKTAEQQVALEDMAFGFSGGLRNVGAKLINKVTKKALPPFKMKVRNLIREKVGNVNSALLDSEKFVNQIDRNLTSVQREAIPFLREGTKVPKNLKRPDIEKAIKEAPEQLKLWSKKVGDYYDEAHEFIVRESGKDANFVKDYINRIWDIPKKKEGQVTKWFVTNNPHISKQRVVNTIKEGVDKFGLKPKTLDVSDLIRTYDNFKVRTIYNNKFADALNKIQTDTGAKIIQRIDKAPSDWVKFDVPALNRVAGRQLGEGTLLLNKLPVKVHPDIAKEVNSVFGESFTGRLPRALNTINAILKKAQLSVSFFHHLALTETAIPLTGVRKTMKLWNPVKVYRALKNKDFEIFKKMDVAKDGLKNGLTLGALPDVQVGTIQNLLQSAENKLRSVPIAGKVAKMVRSANNVWDDALWGYYHNGLKLNAYETLVGKELKKAKPGTGTDVKREIAQFVNDTFGGQNWELLFKSPKWQQVMNWTFLSPDWTWSTVRQALSPTGIGAVGKSTKGLRQKIGAKFWAKAGLYFYGSMNMLNYALTKRETGEGKWMWENDPAHKTHLFIGKDEQGRNKYMRWGKQFRELPELMLDPVKKVGGKLSPAVQQTFIQATGRTASGFPTPLGEEMEKGKEGLGLLGPRLKEVAKAPLPFAITGAVKTKSPLSFAFPVSPSSEFRFRQAFEDALRKGDKAKIQELSRQAVENEFDPSKLLKGVVSKAKREKTLEAKSDAQGIIDQLRKIRTKEGKRRKIAELKKQGKITPKIEKQIKDLILSKIKVKSLKEKLRNR